MIFIENTYILTINYAVYTPNMAHCANTIIHLNVTILVYVQISLKIPVCEKIKIIFGQSINNSESEK